jgi:branched-chain amino acid transport system substrate-binding protein
MRILRIISITLAAAAMLFTGLAAAQQPIKVGMSMPQTGSLGAGGKAALLALQMWVEDVNAKGGLLGRKVEFIVYDDQTNPALTPGIYTKLLDVDKVDLIIAPYGTVPTAPSCRW